MAAPDARPAAQPGNWVDPYRAYNFKLLINDITEAHFTEVTGLGMRVEHITYREAGSNATVRSIPGRVSYSPITLRYGVTAASQKVWEWMLATSEGRVLRREASIVLLDPTGATEVLRWNLQRAWPQEWYGAPLDAMSQELAIETLVLVHEGLDRVAGGGGTSA